MPATPGASYRLGLCLNPAQHGHQAAASTCAGRDISKRRASGSTGFANRRSGSATLRPVVIRTKIAVLGRQMALRDENRAAANGTFKVLVIEDDPDMADYVETLL